MTTSEHFEEIRKSFRVIFDELATRMRANEIVVVLSSLLKKMGMK